MDAQVAELGDAQYSIAYYDVPSVPEQPRSSTGWSFNAVQNLNHTRAIFSTRERRLGFPDADKRFLCLGWGDA